MSGEVRRIVLAERAPRSDYAVAFAGDAFVVEGVPLLPDRSVAARRVYGLERSGAWLWIGAGLVPVLVGGDDVPSERLARAEAELRAQIRALPDGASRLARIDARAAVRLHRPWLGATVAGIFALTCALGPHRVAPLAFVTDLLLLLSFGLLAEPWLGARRVLASGGAALLALAALAPSHAWLGLAPLALALGWAGLLAVIRLRHERVLSVRLRSALDLAALLGLALGARAFTAGAGRPALLLAALMGAALAPLLLRRWPEGAPPLH